MSNTTAAPEEASPDTAFHAGPARAHPGIQTTRNGAGPELPPGPGWAEEVRRLAAERDAVILAHNYQRPEIQDVADHVGDSLALSRLAADSPARDDRVRRRVLHGRDGEDPPPGQDRAHPGRSGPAARWPTASPPTSCGSGRPSTRARPSSRT